MASSSSLYFLILFCSLVIFATPSLAKIYFKPKALVLPASKAASTLTYLTNLPAKHLILSNVVKILSGIPAKQLI
ncbi:hypothetical protein ACFX2F_022222 [Malus domestica]